MASYKKPRLRDLALRRLLSVVFLTLCGVLLLIFLLGSNSSTTIETNDLQSVDDGSGYRRDLKFTKLQNLPQQSDLSKKLEKLNLLPPRNLDLYPNIGKDAIIVVLYVHNRPQYLKVVVESLAKVVGINETLLIVSHDGYFEEMNKIIGGIRFCQVK
jgi:alpha-1,6-mannosyl-glycoprotein beta-1,2-N-acetylglucosaminyltransferase